MRKRGRDHSWTSSRSPSSSQPANNKSPLTQSTSTPAPTQSPTVAPSWSFPSHLLLPLLLALLLCQSSVCTGAAATSSLSRGPLHPTPPSSPHGRGETPHCTLPATTMALLSTGPYPPSTLASMRTMGRRLLASAAVGASSPPPLPPSSSRLPSSSLTSSFIPSSSSSWSATPRLLFDHRRRPRRHSARLFASSSASSTIGGGGALHGGDGGGGAVDEPSTDEGMGMNEGDGGGAGSRPGKSLGDGRGRRWRPKPATASAAGRHVVVDEIRRSLLEEVLPAVLGRIEEPSAVSTTTKIGKGVGDEDKDTDKDVLVLVIAVSGGCDSVALLHGVMDLVSEIPPARRSGDCDASNSSSSSSPSSGAPRFVLHLSEPAGRPGDDHGIKKTMSGDGGRDDARPDDEGTSAPMVDVDVDGTATTTTIPCEIHVAHFDHRTRGSESDGDRLFVEDLCRDDYSGLNFHCYSWGVDGYGFGGVCDEASNDDGKDGAVGEGGCEGRAGFSQGAAREWRRRTLSGLLRTLTALGTGDGDDGAVPPRPGVVLTAHHGDDSDETVLLKFLRGAHLSNLSGMEPVRRFASSRPPFSDDDGDDESPSSEPTTRRGALFARPMLGLRKSDIREFLLGRRLSWREDGSNATGKYLRNRVRNELIPLLEDFVGGRDALQKRISNLAEQSRSVKDDLSIRAERYLAENSVVVDDFDPTADGRTPRQLFPLPKKRGAGVHGKLHLDLVHEEALHRWTERRMAEEEAGRGEKVDGLSYEQLRRVCTQLAKYPNNTIWSLDVGGGWTVSRRGDTLDLQRCTRRTLSRKEQDRRRRGKRHDHEHSGRKSSLSPDDAEDCTQSSSSWSIVDVSKGGDGPPPKPRHDGDVLRQLTVVLPRGIGREAEAMTLVLKTLGEGEGENGRLPFTPPWRRGRRPIPVKEFLRGQGVPLHRRGSAPLLCCLYPTEDVVEDDRMIDITVLAVHVDPDWNKNPQARSGWVVGAQFEVSPPKTLAAVKERRLIWLARTAQHHRTTF